MDQIKKLPKPQKEPGFPLMKALEKRRSIPFLRSKETQRFSAWVDTGHISQNGTCIMRHQTLERLSHP